MRRAGSSLALAPLVLAALAAACAPGPDRIPRGDALRGVPAGVVPYACVEGAALVLLAYDPEPDRAGWGHFGGSSKWRETAAETAARELREETNCAFPGPRAADLSGLPASGSGGFWTFCAELPWRDPAQIARPRPGCPDVERSRWVWVRHADLVAALDGPSTRPEVAVASGGELPQTIALWPGAAGSLRRSVEHGVLAREDPCAARDSGL